MATVVVNCFHWIGFHFTEMLIEQGEEVIGVQGSKHEKSDFLSMFVSRNSLFTHKNDMPEKAEKVIVIGYTNKIPKSDTIIQCLTGDNTKNVNKESHLCIEIPLLYGEWMPMDKSGIYVDNKHILFTSRQFKEKAVYVKDFIKNCLDSLDGNMKDTKESLSKNQEFILENNPCFRDNRNKNKKVEKLQEHYLRYASFYYE